MIVPCICDCNLFELFHKILISYEKKVSNKKKGLKKGLKLTCMISQIAIAHGLRI